MLKIGTLALILTMGLTAQAADYICGSPGSSYSAKYKTDAKWGGWITRGVIYYKRTTLSVVNCKRGFDRHTGFPGNSDMVAFSCFENPQFIGRRASHSANSVVLEGVTLEKSSVIMTDGQIVATLPCTIRK